LASSGEDPWEIGRQRQAKRAQSGQIVAIEAGGRVVAALTGYAIPEQPGPIPDDMPAIFRPLQELENLAPSTWHVNVLATMPQYRGRGFGKQLLDIAETTAQSEKLNAMSARRLYERAGYRETARRLILKEDWQTRGQEWVLMLKRLPQDA
jgi:ribosomal protein S18 acetylase RimI-like enzyme